MMAEEQLKEEMMIEICLEDEDCLDDEDQKQDVIQNPEIKECVQRGSGHTPAASKSLPEDRRNKERTVGESEFEEISEKFKLKTETGRRKRKKGNKLFPCDKCSLVSHSSANLKKHMMTHTGEKPYECRTCHKSFRQRHHLVDHWRIHSGERPFKCEVCGSRFIQKSSLNLHKKRHLGIKPFSCTHCSYATYEKMHLIVHMRTHTGEKPYQCEKCGQTFSTATRLKFHRMIHTGERRYKCEKCGVPFREKVTLQAHMAVHINLGPFECEECGQEFSRLAGLSLHRKVHDNKDSYLYVYNKEANQCFKSALKNASHKKSAAIKEPFQESVRTPSSESDWDTESDDACTTSSTNTPEQEESTVLKSGSQETPVTSPQHSLGSASCLFPEDDCSPASKVSSSSETDPQHKLKENLASNLKYSFEQTASDVHPDQVREALEKGTVLETQGDDGKGFFIVLPPSLKNKDIMVLSDSPQTTITSNISDSSMTLEDRGSAFEGHISPNILSENMLETHKTLYPSVVEEVQECDMDSVELQEEICSEVEGEMIHPCEAESVECIFNTDSPEEVLEPLGKYSEAIEEHLHSDGTSLLLWKDNSINQLTNVTYIIEDGKKEPIVIHTQEEGCIPEFSDAVSTVKGKKKRKCKGSEHSLEERDKSSNLEAGNSVALKIKINSRKSKIKKQKSQKVYNCEQCGKACKNSSNYIAHLRTHSGERPYFCGFCRMGFKQISHLRSHIRIHTGERPYVCSLCNAAFTQSSRLNSHKKNVHPNGQIEIKKKKEKYIPENRIKNFFCRYCNKTYIGECLKIDHMKIHRPPLPYRCNICGMQFKTKNSMQSHSMKHSDCKHICEMCGVEVSSLEDLHKHRLTEHGKNSSNSDKVDMYINVKIGEENGFIVLNPAIKDGHNDTLGIQLKTESSDDSETSLCEVKQEVIHVTDVDGSVKSEIEVTPSHVKDEVAVHDITHASPEKEKPNNVEQEDSNLTHSQKEMSGPVNDDYDIAKEGEMKKKFITYTDVTGRKIWVCKVCDRSFFQSSNLYCHMRMHTGDKPYRCNVCPRAFRQITHLKDHMRRHTGAKPHKCGECGKCFAQRSAVRRHIRVLHGGNAVALRIPESDMRNQIIDTLMSECDLISEDKEMRNVLDGKDTFHQDDEQLCKLPHKENVSHVCRVCKKQFTQISNFTAHIRRCGKRKKNKKVYAVDNRLCECGENFLSVAQLLKHQETCCFEEDEGDNLENEMGNIPSSGENDLKKSGCENDKVTDAKKSKHKLMKSTNGSTLVTQNQFKCKQCGEVLHGITSYKTHLEGHGGELCQVCMVCGEVFKRASALRYHQSMKHGKEDRRYRDFCPTGYINVQEEDLEDEIVKVKVEVDFEENFNLTDENKKEKMVCDVELNTLVKSGTMFYNHELRQGCKNTKEDALKTISNVSEKGIENDKESSENYEENPETKTSACTTLEMTLTRSSKLRQHVSEWCKGQHGSENDTDTTSEKHKPHTEKSTPEVNKIDREPESRGKNWKSRKSGNTSNLCSKSTTVSECTVDKSDSDVPTSSAIIKKDTIKQINAEFFCKFCDKHFSDESSCDKHMLSHAAEKPFKCEHCMLRFKRKAHLFNHYRRHAREEC